ncbi:hypothetical protein [Aeromonas veronii]|nr:hypothetical protein [Aeromonas veronii]
MALSIAAPEVYFLPDGQKQGQRKTLGECVQHQRLVGNVLI